MTNTSIKAAFERMWQHIINALGGKSNVGHTHIAEEVGATQVQIITWEDED